MKNLKLTFLFLLSFSINNLHAQNAGSIDNTFNNGEVSFANLSFANGFPWGVVQQSDGKIVAFHEYANNAYLVRYNTDGSIDTDFGVDTIPYRARSLTVGPNDELYMGTFTGNLVKIDADGTLDTSFNSDIVNTWIYGVDLQSDGKILTQGRGDDDWVISRFNTDGTLDTDFAMDGSLEFDFLNQSTDWGRSVQSLSDGSVLACGWSDNFVSTFQTYLIQLDSNGSLDVSFGADGIVELIIGDFGTLANNFHVLNDGKILIAGVATNITDSTNTFIARLHADGQLDNSFGTNGIVQYPTYEQSTATGFRSETNTKQVLYSEFDDKIIVNGRYRLDTLSNNGFGIRRYNSDGTIDNTFGINGLASVVIDTLDIFFTTSHTDGMGNIIQVGRAMRDSADVDIVAIKYLGSNVVGTLDFDIEQHSMMVYPNPIETNCTLAFTLNGDLDLDIFITDRSGKRIDNFYTAQHFTTGDHQLDLNLDGALPTGNYFITIMNEGVPITIQVFKK